MTRPLQVERALYRGFVLVMDCYEVQVLRADGRRIGCARTLSGARRIVRGYRRAVA